MNPLLELLEHGQSYWLDNLAREKILSGEIERRVREEGLRGITSNPAIFHKAITGGDAYDEEIERLVRRGLSVTEVYEGLVVADIRSACDLLRPVFEESEGSDGFVSLEVSPYLAHDTQGSLEEARRLFAAVDRPNVMIKIPGTPAGVPAIEEALYEGIHVNVTLLFSISSYEAVAEAYLRALERRLDEGKPLDCVASVASFFLSRIDVLVDRLLGQRIRAEVTSDAAPARLLGKAAIANAKLAYQSFQRTVASDRWARLAERGAQVQRMLWASTSTKNPLYDDVRYVEPLIGPHTVNTLPDDTIEAFRDHGVVETTIERDLEEAAEVMDRLGELGIDFDEVTRRLLDEGVQKFIDPYDRLMEALARRRGALLGGCLAEDRLAPGQLERTHAAALAALREQQVGRRLFARDASLWTEDPERAAAIRERLGWLDSPGLFAERLEEIADFAAEVRAAGFDYVVLLGMGGSSLAAEVARDVIGGREGAPRLLLLDDTDPRAVRAVEAEIDPARTLFLVASKSGTTAETWSFYRYFHERVRARDGQEAGSHFAAITDPGTPLAEEARRAGFRRLFENPPDIGGRYSALSYFGLVPMGLMGLDLEALLNRALAMRGSCEPSVPPAAHPGLRLGALLGMAGRRGRDKVTFHLEGRLGPFGIWVEQLLAESTGKDGRGLVPVLGDPLFAAAVARRSEAVDALLRSEDRVFVRLRIASDPPATEAEALLDALASRGHPVVRIELDDPVELGAEFLRWEIATAVAGIVLGVDPFDEPNVAEAKEQTQEVLAAWRERGGFQEGAPLAEDERLAAFAPHAGTREVSASDPGAVLEAFLDDLQAGAYVAVLDFLPRTPKEERELALLRSALARRSRLPVIAGHGPRYLHSTGQLHKGGAATGAFLLLTADPAEDLPIPGADHGFGVLQRAQALGDYQALSRRERRVLRIHLKGDPVEALSRLRERIEATGQRPVQVG